MSHFVIFFQQMEEKKTNGSGMVGKTCGNLYFIHNNQLSEDIILCIFNLFIYIFLFKTFNDLKCIN